MVYKSRAIKVATKCYNSQLPYRSNLSSNARTKRDWLVDSEPLVAPASMG
ncbi:hypothetical protein [Enterobacter phage fGh-Ecl02]|nr:hypothetical protein [Enterobacter phage fGh-Ecl02]